VGGHLNSRLFPLCPYKFLQVSFLVNRSIVSFGPLFFSTLIFLSLCPHSRATAFHLSTIFKYICPTCSFLKSHLNLLRLSLPSLPFSRTPPLILEELLSELSRHDLRLIKITLPPSPFRTSCSPCPFLPPSHPPPPSSISAIFNCCTVLTRNLNPITPPV